MADFCKGCTEELFGPDLPNDLRFYTEPRIALCEGCGFHIFNGGGERSHPIEGSTEQAATERCLICFPEEVKT